MVAYFKVVATVYTENAWDMTPRAAEDLRKKIEGQFVCAACVWYVVLLLVAVSASLIGAPAAFVMVGCYGPC